MKKINLVIKDKSWIRYNDVYEIPINMSLEEVFNKKTVILTEEALLIKSPHYVIEVGYYPYDPKRMKLSGSIIKDQNYDVPIEKKTFKNSQEAKKWINNWIKKIEELEKKERQNRYGGK